MCIFYNKSLLCGCKIVAVQTREDIKCVYIDNHCYKTICKRCINMSDQELNKRLEKIRENDNKIFVSFLNGWYRSSSSPTDYTIPNQHLVFGVDYY